jgi:NitT/TauT family transport system ATP-binding protein/nitrate/nitrite transport system substrate-binding protein
MRIGLLRLTDAAPVIMAQELGLFAAEGLEVDLSMEPSSANIADKLVHGFLDAAVIAPPLAFAMALGLRGPARGILIPQSLSLGGNTVTLGASLARRVAAHLVSGRWTSLVKARAFAAALKDGREKPTLAVVHQYSTHNLLLRYWLAAGGIDPDNDVTLIVLPPAQMVEALRSGRIAGFCAGAPWGAIVKKSKLGTTMTTSHGIWQNGPEKALAVNQAWADSHPGRLLAAQRALLRAAQFCDASQNAALIAKTLCADAYLGVEAEVVASSLPKARGGNALHLESFFFRHGATVPWYSHALWFLHQMARWRLIPAATDFKRVAEQVYRPDLYAAAARSLNLSVPRKMFKTEGHGTAWRCTADPSPIDMEPDGFCDGVPFAPNEA